MEKAAADPGWSMPFCSRGLCAYCTNLSDTLIKNVKTCIQELEDILETQDFLSSNNSATFGDFGVFGKYVMLHGVRPELADELFLHGKVGSWIERIIQTYKLEDFMARKW